jgi:thiol-disulfide isomerase/thioredoxin
VSAGLHHRADKRRRDVVGATAPAATRRVLLGGLAAGAGSLLLAACGDDTSGRYGSDVATEIDSADRTDPIEFSGTTFDDDEFSTADVLGQVLVINVWYASCAPCRKEAPELKAIFEDYENQDVAFVGVNVRDAAGPAQAFEKNYEVPYPSLPDTDSEIMYSMHGQVSPNAVPSTLVLDVEGRVAARISGAIDSSILRAMLDKVLAE